MPKGRCALGDSVNTAARLATAAGADEALISEATCTTAGITADILESRYSCKGKRFRWTFVYGTSARHDGATNVGFETKHPLFVVVFETLEGNLVYRLLQ